MRQVTSIKHLFLLGLLLAAPLYASAYIYQEDFENGLGGWVIDNAFGRGNGFWHLTTACQATMNGHSAATALAYMQDATCNYDTDPDLATQGVATSPDILLPGAIAKTRITLKVKYFLMTEGWVAVDKATIEISQNGGPFAVIARNYGDVPPVRLTDGSGDWLETTLDLTAYAGSSIRLRVGFDTDDEIKNEYPGFYVDDITISALLYYEDFENGLGGFVIDNNFGLGSGMWHLTTFCKAVESGHSQPKALGYMHDVSCTYNNLVMNQGVATSPGIRLPGSLNAPIALKVKYFLGTEQVQGYDWATVEVSQNGGPFSTIAINETGPAGWVRLTDGSGVWQEMTADLTAYAGSIIQLRFGFNTRDTESNDFAGFYVDDIMIYTPPVYYEDFEDGLEDWWIDNAYGNGNGLWHLSTVCQSDLEGHSAVSTLAYAQDATCTYNNGLTHQGIVDSPYIDLSPYPNGTFKLTLKYFLQTEHFAGLDRTTVEISKDGGPFETLAVNYDNIYWPVVLTESPYDWQEMTADISAYAGSEIQLRFGFNTGDSINNDWPGFYVDDITIDSVPCLFTIVGDLNGDCRVNLADVAMLAQNWLLDCLENPGQAGCVLAY